IPSLLRQGRSMLMATDDLGKVEDISARTVWVEEGRVRMDGASRSVLDAYLAPRVTAAAPDPSGVFPGIARLAGVQLLDECQNPAKRYCPGDAIVVALDIEVRERVERPYVLIGIAGAFGPIVAASMFHDGWRPDAMERLYHIECAFEDLVLAPRQCFT